MSTTSQPIVIVVKFQPSPGEEEAVEKACREAIQAVHSEPGCERFALHRATEGFAMVLIEKWSSGDALQTHGKQPAYAALGASLEGRLVGAPEITMLHPLPEGDARLGTL